MSLIAPTFIAIRDMESVNMPPTFFCDMNVLNVREVLAGLHSGKG